MFNNDYIRVQINNDCYTVRKNTKVIDFLPMIKNRPDNILGIMVNNENHSLNYVLKFNCTCKFATYGTDAGDRIYTRSLKYIFIMAFRKLYPELVDKIIFSNKISRDIFLKVEGLEITDEIVEKVKTQMDSICKKDYKIEKKKAEYGEMIDLHRNEKQLNNLKYKFKDAFTVYNCCDDSGNVEINYLYGNLVYSTGYIKNFDLRKNQDNVNELILVLPNRDDIESIDPNCTSDKISALFKSKKVPGPKTVFDLNKFVIDGKSYEIIKEAEEDHSKRLENLVDNIITRHDTRLILVTGPSSSGKTTFSNKLKDDLQRRGKKALIVSLDNYFNDLENIPKDKYGNYDYDCIENVEVDMFSSHMKDLLAGDNVDLPEYNFKESKKVFNNVYTHIDNDEILIIEGIHTFNPKILSCFDPKIVFKIFVSPLVTISYDDYTKVSSSDTRFIRRAYRDFMTRGNDLETTFSYWNKLRMSENKYIFPYIHEADAFYNTSLVYELCVLKLFIEACLLNIQRDSCYFADAKRLYELLANFPNIIPDNIPEDSIIREFIGGGCYDL